MDKFWGALPWPLCICVFLLSVLWVCKKEIRGLINRVRKVGHKDTAITLDPQVEQQAELTESPPSKGLIKRDESSLSNGKEIRETGAVLKAQNSTLSGEGNVTQEVNEERARILRTVGVSPLVAARENLIRRDMSNIPDVTEREYLLVRNLAVAQLQWTAERFYRVIFGSQLALLQHLNIVGPTRTEQLVERFYNPAVERHSKIFEDYSVEAYMAFLSTNELIVNHPDGKAAITPAGKESLAWIATNGVQMEKPG